MRRLHLKLYLAIVGTMVVFLIAGAMVWHHFAPPHMAMGGIESATELAAAMLDDGDHDPAREREVVVALSRQLHARCGAVRRARIGDRDLWLALQWS